MHCHPSTSRARRGAALFALLAFPAAAIAAPPLETIMQHPDWIGPPVEAAWWQLDGEAYHYRVKRAGSPVRDTWRVDVDSGEAERLPPAALSGSDGPDPVVNAEASAALTVRGDSLFLRDLESGALVRLFSGPEPVSSPAFSADQAHAHFESGGRWWRVALAGGGAWPVADLRFQRAPHEPEPGALAEDQLRLFDTVERQRANEEARHAAAVAAAAAEPGLGAAPWYLGPDREAVASALSADARWLLLVVRESCGGGEEAGAGDGSCDQAGRPDRMPRFVTRSGYVAVEDVRTLVGRDTPRPQALWLLDLVERTRHELDLGALPGRDEDPLAALREARGLEAHDADDPRPVHVEGLRWHPEQAVALVQVHSIDNKDRWTVRVRAADASVSTLHRLTDPAWINWAFNEFGWVPGGDTAWLLSEESGYSHLYTVDAAGRLRQHTRGAFEVFDVTFARDGRSAWMLSNREHPTRYDLYRLTLAGGDLARLSSLRGVESYAVHPVDERILLRYSGSYLPAQAAVLEDGVTTAATETRTDGYRDLAWQAPRFVPVPSSHHDRPIWSKFYPARGGGSGPRPAVLFVHGAGYTQNTHHRFPYYFREQMFHNLLTERGYHVLDMDYRASRGYGRDWRTAIYRRMGTPELEDLRDGVRWLTGEHGVDPARIGVYGGSYGGFMTFMAMFRAPEVFAAGASLRPVTDWAHYNHPYTSNILNTPQLDPEAYARSSPIEFVAGLEGDLLISHGMLDDNVFYKDSVRLVQRLIELGKENWEFASYPLEPHGFEQPESWLDQYRRILKLFERTIGREGAPGAG